MVTLKDTSHGIMVNELGYQTIVSELDSQQMLHISNLVSPLR